MSTMTPEQRVTKVFELLENSGKKEYIAGRLTRLDQALQAAQMAKNGGADEETILAALFCNIGCYIPPAEEWSDARGMERIKITAVDMYGNDHIIDISFNGGEYLRQLGFPNKTCVLVESNVITKRYILATDHTRSVFIYDVLTPMDPWVVSPDQISKFKDDVLFQYKIQLLKWEIAAADTIDIKPAAALDTYRDMAIRNIQI
ncbi:hypothetical protein GGI19_000254 [Coemansia pectinata]|uniref:Uncharacterized protein n=1 Tax=Coemansia pectinata TaxID=1052879 RepID=A0A9W8H4F8_9FUNG|nr:hypothetical protein GGI19_000254 [Coemansia pectinata]